MRAIQLVDGGKVCNGCREWKHASEYHRRRNRRDGKALGSRCKACVRIQNDNEVYRLRDRARYARNRESVLAQQREKKYGVSPDEYDDMITVQGGVCAVCQQPESARNRRGEIRQLAVDHDHATGRVRGLLCALCNAGIGCFADDTDRLAAAVAYLMESGDR